MDENSDDEYETIDVSDNPIYQVLSLFLESSEGDNICDVLLQLKGSLDKTNDTLNKILKTQTKKNNNNCSNH